MAGRSSTRLFGTDGIRGLAGAYPLDDETVRRIGASLANYHRQEFNRSPRFVIGRDTRESGPGIARALSAGAISAGAEVECAGVITTPGVAFITGHGNFDAGIVISASHNPYADNGIKVFVKSGKKLADEVERLIEGDVASPDITLAHSSQNGLKEFERYRQEYIGYLTTRIGEGLDLRGLKLVMDCANGAASDIAPAVFKALGADVVVIGAAPNGRNINDGCGSLHTDELATVVVRERAALGVAFDGDADRALFVDSDGSLVDGDRTLLILSKHLKAGGRLSGDTVVATVMSNMGLEVALKERGITLVRAPVGDRFVLDELLKRNAKLGGEQSGHIIFPAISLAGDGIITALEVLKSCLEAGKSLKLLASGMTRFPQVLINVRVSKKPALEELPEVQSAIDRIEREMNGQGRLLVRYSGTENLARVMAEGPTQEEIERHARELAGMIERVIG